MKTVWINASTKVGTTGFVITKAQEVKRVVITSIKDISYHGSSSYMANYKFTNFPSKKGDQIEYYYATEDDALLALRNILLKAKNEIKLSRAKLKEDLQSIKASLKAIKLKKYVIT